MEQIIRTHGGAIPSQVTDAYVEPTCWEEIVRRMDTKHAIVLAGPSGTGKTTTAKAIARYLKKRFSGLAEVEPGSPTAIRSCRNEGPTLFYLDDPWGKYEITKDRQPWTAELPGFLHQASAHRMFVVTTRSDIFNEATGDSDAFSRWAIELRPSSYGVTQREQLYKNRLEQLPNGGLKTAALDGRSRVLEKLDTPFEIDRFFKHLIPGPAHGDRNEAAFIERVLASTQRDAIELEVKQLVESRAAVHWAAVLWGLMAANRGVDRADLPNIRRQLSLRDSDFKSGLEALVNALVAGGSLRQPGSKASYPHPRVELGLLSAMRAEPETTEAALCTLLSVMVDLDASGPGSGGGTATRVYARMLKDTSWRFISPQARTGIDRWIEHALGTCEDNYPALVSLAAATGSDNSISAEVARWLSPGPGKKRRQLLDAWREPFRTEEWYERVKAHHLTRHICVQFVTKVLPVESGLYPEALADFLDRLGGELGRAWLNAALDNIEEGYLPNGRAIAYGAMRYEENRVLLSERALSELRSLKSPEYDEAETLAIEDGHFDEDDLEDYEQLGEAASQLCSAYVERLRIEGDWRRIARSDRLTELLHYWSAAICSAQAGEISREELLSLFEHAIALGQDTAAWRVAQHHWQREFEAPLRACLRRGHPTELGQRAVAQCALVAAPNALREEVAVQLLQRSKKRFFELLFEVGHARFYGPASELKQGYLQFVAGLPEPCREIAGLFGVRTIPEVMLSDEALAIAVQGIVECTGRLQAILLQAAALRREVSPGLTSEIINSSEPETAMSGVRAAKAAGRWDLIESAINHRRADVRCLAFGLVVERSGGVVAPQWLNLATDKSSRVRKALATALAEKPFKGALAALVVLCGDQWVSQSHPYPYEVFPIARRAALALADVPDIGQADARRLLSLARKTHDPELQWRIHLAVSRNSDDDARAALAHIVFSREEGQIRVSAMRALACAGDIVADAILGPLTSAWLNTVEPNLALWGCVAMGSCLAVSRSDEACEKLATSETRRVLLIAIALGWEERDPALAQRPLDWLPPLHRARQLFSCAEPLPSDVFDDLGEIEMVNAVLSLCEGRVEARLKAAGAD